MYKRARRGRTVGVTTVELGVEADNARRLGERHEAQASRDQRRFQLAQFRHMRVRVALKELQTQQTI